MTDLAMAYYHGISYQDYMQMDAGEFEEAAHGAMMKQDQVLRLLRLIAFMMHRYIGGKKTRGDKIKDYFPLYSDNLIKETGISQKEKDEADAIFAKWDAAKNKK